MSSINQGNSYHIFYWQSFYPPNEDFSRTMVFQLDNNLFELDQ